MAMETNSDTEVILACWSLYQHESIHMLNGMFAFIIYDKYISKLTIVRDRFGIKPLYYFHQKDAIYFSSEIKPLLKFVLKLQKIKIYCEHILKQVITIIQMKLF